LDDDQKAGYNQEGFNPRADFIRQTGFESEIRSFMKPRGNKVIEKSRLLNTIDQRGIADNPKFRGIRVEGVLLEPTPGSHAGV